MAFDLSIIIPTEDILIQKDYSIVENRMENRIRQLQVDIDFDIQSRNYKGISKYRKEEKSIKEEMNFLEEENGGGELKFRRLHSMFNGAQIDIDKLDFLRCFDR
jgi:hypothetical protein